MMIIVTSNPTGLFTRLKKRVERFTDDSGDWESALQHIALMIACEHDIRISVITPQRQTADALLSRVGVCWFEEKANECPLKHPRDNPMPKCPR